MSAPCPRCRLASCEHEQGAYSVRGQPRGAVLVMAGRDIPGDAELTISARLLAQMIYVAGMVGRAEVYEFDAAGRITATYPPRVDA